MVDDDFIAPDEDEIDDEAGGSFEHYRFVSDKGQSLLRVDKFITMRMQFMHENELCTTIDVDFMNKKIYIKNHTDDMIHRAFGVVKNPTWEEFEGFLERRCFPKTRANLKNVLRDVGVSSYDPLQIIEKTQGRMAEDRQWIKISYLSKRGYQNGNH